MCQYNLFDEKFYFPTKVIHKYDEKIDNILNDWLDSFINNNKKVIFNNNVLDNEEINILSEFIKIKTKELFTKILHANRQFYHNVTIKYIFVACFFITYKYYTSVDYEIINLKTLSKAFPITDESKVKQNLSKIENDILEFTSWKPFSINE